MKRYSYLFQYRREQRAENAFEAESHTEAWALAENWMSTLDLASADDTSDDPGELSILEITEISEESSAPQDPGDKAVGENLEGIQRVLDLSAAHLPCSVPEWGDLRVVSHQYGFIVFVSSERLGGSYEPGWATEFMAYARKTDCLLVNFDAAGDTLDFLPKWEW